MKVSFAFFLFLVLASPINAQSTTEEIWARYMSITDIVHFEYPTDLEIREPDPPFGAVYTRIILESPNEPRMGINITVEELAFSEWGDFNLPRETDFQTLIDRAVRWRWTDYTIVELGNRKFIHHTEVRNDVTLLYWNAFLDTGIMVTVLAAAPTELIDEVIPFAEHAGATLEYAGDFPVDLSCAPLDDVYSFPIDGGQVALASSSLWEESVVLLPSGMYEAGIRNDEKPITPERECFGIPDMRFILQVFPENDLTLAEIEEAFIQSASEDDQVISMEQITVNNRAVLVIKSEDYRVAYRYYLYIGTLNEDFAFRFVFRSLPGQMERWQELALQMVESITFTPTE